MRHAVHDRKLTEVLVECDQDSAFSMCTCGDFFVPGVRWPIADPGNIVPCGLE